MTFSCFSTSSPSSSAVFLAIIAVFFFFCGIGVAAQTEASALIATSAWSMTPVCTLAASDDELSQGWSGISASPVRLHNSDAVVFASGSDVMVARASPAAAAEPVSCSDIAVRSGLCSVGTDTRPLLSVAPVPSAALGDVIVAKADSLHLVTFSRDLTTISRATQIDSLVDLGGPARVDTSAWPYVMASNGDCVAVFLYRSFTGSFSRLDTFCPSDSLDARGPILVVRGFLARAGTLHVLLGFPADTPLLARVNIDSSTGDIETATLRVSFLSAETFGLTAAAFADESEDGSSLSMLLFTNEARCTAYIARVSASNHTVLSITQRSASNRPALCDSDAARVTALMPSSDRQSLNVVLTPAPIGASRVDVLLLQTMDAAAASQRNVAASPETEECATVPAPLVVLIVILCLALVVATALVTVLTRRIGQLHQEEKQQQNGSLKGSGRLNPLASSHDQHTAEVTIEIDREIDFECENIPTVAQRANVQPLDTSLVVVKALDDGRPPLVTRRRSSEDALAVAAAMRDVTTASSKSGSPYTIGLQHEPTQPGIYHNMSSPPHVVVAHDDGGDHDDGDAAARPRQHSDAGSQHPPELTLPGDMDHDDPAEGSIDLAFTLASIDPGAMATSYRNADALSGSCMNLGGLGAQQSTRSACDGTPAGFSIMNVLTATPRGPGSARSPLVTNHTPVTTPQASHRSRSQSHHLRSFSDVMRDPSAVGATDRTPNPFERERQNSHNTIADSEPISGSVLLPMSARPLPTNIGVARELTEAEVVRHNGRCEAVLRREYQRGKLLGRGAQGSVYAALLNDGSTIAYKELPAAGVDEAIEAIGEMTVLLELRHDNLVMFYGAAHDAENQAVRLFMECVTGGSLGAMVRGMDMSLPEAAARAYVRQIVAGLAFLHANGVVHRDLKCDNVLRDVDTGLVKLADFGAARSIGPQGQRAVAHTIVGTPLFMAPEVLAAGCESEFELGYGPKADVWSLGILVAELLDRGHTPWPTFPSPAHAFLHIADPSSSPVLAEHLSPTARSFIHACIARDPADRPSAEELSAHPWLQLPAAVGSAAPAC